MARTGLTALEVVLSIAQRHSFRGAARELGMSPTAVSNAVAGLEAELNIRLFHRSTRSVALTEAGQRYVDRIAPALAEIRRAAEEISATPETPSGRLRINVPPECTSLLFEPLIGEFMARYPEMRLDIVSEPHLVDIVAEGFDAGIRLAEMVPQDMIAVPLTPDTRLLMVASPDYLAHHPAPQTPDDLAAHLGIGMRMAHGGVYQWELERRGQRVTVKMDNRLVLSEVRAIPQAARAGLGLAFVSEWFVAADIAAGRLVSVMEEWCTTFGGLRLYYPGHRHIPAGLKAFSELARELNGRGRPAG